MTPAEITALGLALIVFGSAWAGWNVARRVIRYMLGGRL
jgi:hypothetical protein